MIRICLMMILACVFCAGCGGTQEPEPDERAAVPSEPSGMPEAYGMLRVSDGMPGVHLRAFKFAGSHESELIEIPETGAEVQFSPFCASASEAGFELSVIHDEVERRIYSGAARPMDETLPKDESILPLVGARVRVPMDEFAGSSVRLSWKSVGGTGKGRIAIAGLSLVSNPPPDSNRPPILIICSDTHRADFAFDGEGRDLMPRLGRFGAGAVVYDRAYSAASWTLTSMVSLFTGLWPLYHKAGAHPTPEARLENAKPYNPSLVSMPEVLRDAGYATWFFHTNPYLYHSGLFADGFDAAIGADFITGADAERVIREVIAQLPGERPVFLFVHLMDLHQYKALQFKEMFPGVRPEFSDRERARAAYGAAARVEDDCIGGILDAWDAKFGLDKSLIIYCSDHGEHLFDPGHAPITPEEFQEMRIGLHMVLPLLSHGSSMEDALLRVPLAVKYPDAMGVAPGRCDAAVSLIDVFPTIAALTASDSDGLGLQGVPLFPLPLKEMAAMRVFHADLQPYGDMLSSVRRGEFKLVINHTRAARALFDMTKTGPTEGEPGAGVVNEPITDELNAIFAAYERAAGEFVLPERDPVNPADGMTADLKKLGYIK